MDKVKAWTKTGSAVILAEGEHGKRLINQQFITATGQTVNRTIFDCHHISVIVFPLTAKMEVIAIKQFRPAANEVILELPGGNSEPEEDFLITAKRELKEETGYTSNNLIRFPNKLWPDAGSLTPYFYAVLALECAWVDKPKIDSHEDTETIIVPLAKWMEMIALGEITDLKTIAITLLGTLAFKRTKQ